MSEDDIVIKPMIVEAPRKPSQIKQVLVVRKDLNMRKGKIAAQCAHASMKVVLDQMFKHQVDHEPALTLVMGEGSPLHLWLEGAFAKICVSVNSETELDEVYNKAKEAGILASIIVDSGRTEFHGVPTKTVVAIGPDWGESIDPITGHLPLL